jgi:hypothetical protein
VIQNWNSVVHLRRQGAATYSAFVLHAMHPPIDQAGSGCLRRCAILLIIAFLIIVFVLVRLTPNSIYFFIRRGASRRAQGKTSVQWTLNEVSETIDDRKGDVLHCGPSSKATSRRRLCVLDDVHFDARLSSLCACVSLGAFDPAAETNLTATLFLSLNIRVD